MLCLQLFDVDGVVLILVKAAFQLVHLKKHGTAYGSRPLAERWFPDSPLGKGFLPPLELLFLMPSSQLLLLHEVSPGP